MAKQDSLIPLFVDLDGTLIKTDSMVEAVLSLVRSEPLALFEIITWLFKGKAGFKAELAKRITLNMAELPINTEMVSYLKDQAESGRKLILISASHQSVVDSALEHFQFFSAGYGSDEEINLKSENKLQKINQLTQN